MGLSDLAGDLAEQVGSITSGIIDNAGDMANNLANYTSQLDLLDTVLCGDTLDLQNFLETSTLLDGETILGCAKDSAALAICVKCNSECDNCNVQMDQIKEKQNSCDAEGNNETVLTNCGCDACIEQEKALVDCHCLDSNSEDDSDNIVEQVFVDDSKADDLAAANASDLVASLSGFNIFNEALCSDSTVFQTSMEGFVSTAALVDGETILKCASDAATLTTCILCNKCTNCNEKFHKLKDEHNGSCDEQSELFKYCGCDACVKEEKAMLDCHCSTSAASNLGIWAALAVLPLSISFLN